MSGRWRLTLIGMNTSRVLSHTPSPLVWGIEPSGHVINVMGIEFPAVQGISVTGVSVSHLEIFDLDRHMIVDALALPGGGGRLVNGGRAKIDCGGLRFPYPGDRVETIAPESAPAWHQFRHSTPGECPCGVPKAVCEYHR